MEEDNNKISLKPYIITSLITMLTTLLISLGAFAYWQKNKQIRVVGIQMDEVLATHILEVGASRLSQEQKAQYALKWSKALDETVKEITEDGRTIVLTQKATISGVEDLTEIVEVIAKEKAGSINEFGQSK